MEVVSLVLPIVLAHILAAMSPGPNFLIIAKNSISCSRRAGVYTAIGVVVANILIITGCLLGLAAIVSKSPTVFNVIKYLGALYLTYLGFRSFFSKPIDVTIGKEKTRMIRNFAAARMGFLVGILNPKAILLLFGIFIVVVSPEIPLYVLLLAVAIVVFDDATWYILVALFFSFEKLRDFFTKHQTYFNKIFGILLIYLAVRIALAELSI